VSAEIIRTISAGFSETTQAVYPSSNHRLCLVRKQSRSAQPISTNSHIARQAIEGPLAFGPSIVTEVESD